MKKVHVIKYKYAQKESGDIVFIEDLEDCKEVRSEKYICISCQKELSPKLGKIRQKHFAHKNFCDCSKETYLHKLAKEMFYQEYSYCLEHQLPFKIELVVQEYCDKFEERFGSICDIGENKRVFDLTTRYKKIYLESNDGDFVPDILLMNEDESRKLYIEIAVTHRVTQKKKEIQQIIEFNIKDESDLHFFKNRFIRESSRTKFYNINPRSIKGSCKGEIDCPGRVDVFRIYDNKKILLFPESFARTDELERLEGKHLLYCAAIKPSNKSHYEICREKLIELRNEGIELRNCYLCRYHAENRYRDKLEKPIFCKFLKESFDSNYATDCEYFRT